MKKIFGKGMVQFIKFAFIGVFNTLISEIVYAALVFLRMHYIPASFIGFSVSVINAYYWNSKYVFQEKEGGEKRVWWRVFGKTYLAYSWGYVVNALMLVLWIDIIKISRFMTPLAGWFAGRGMERLDEKLLGDLIAAGLNLLITVPMNFLINKYWAYRQKTEAGGESNGSE